MMDVDIGTFTPLTSLNSSVRRPFFSGISGFVTSRRALVAAATFPGHAAASGRSQRLIPSQTSCHHYFPNLVILARKQNRASASSPTRLERRNMGATMSVIKVCPYHDNLLTDPIHHLGAILTLRTDTRCSCGYLSAPLHSIHIRPYSTLAPICPLQPISSPRHTLFPDVVFAPANNVSHSHLAL